MDKKSYFTFELPDESDGKQEEDGPPSDSDLSDAMEHPSFNLNHPFGFGDADEFQFVGTDDELSFGEDDDEYSKAGKGRVWGKEGERGSIGQRLGEDEVLVIDSDEGTGLGSVEEEGGRRVVRTRTAYDDEDMSI